MENIRENFLKVYNQATNYEKELGIKSYFHYNRLTTNIAQELGFPAHIGPAVFAVLSPNSSYFGNLRDCRRLLEAKKKGLGINDFKVNTYDANKRKAYKLADCQVDPLELIVANKTRNFYLNVLNPNDPIPVTVDGHCYNIARYKRENLVGLRGFTDKKYEILAQNIRDLAKDLNLIPNQLQGILWITWKKIHNLVHSNQIEFWPKDEEIAGLIK